MTHSFSSSLFVRSGLALDFIDDDDDDDDDDDEDNEEDMLLVLSDRVE
jgi:hypothetical protein